MAKTTKKTRSGNYMSAEELKFRMLEHFRETGALDGLQTQLRGKLINEVLKFSSPTKKHDGEDDAKSKSALLPFQVSNWLICEHLKRYKFEYSLSTFTSEANLANIDKLLSIVDVLTVIGYEKDTPNYNSLYSNYIQDSSDSFLTMFLKSVATIAQSNQKEQSAKTVETSKKIAQDEMISLRPTKVFNDVFHDVTSSSGIGSIETEDNINAHRFLKLEREKHEREMQNLRQKLVQELDSLHEQEQQARFEIEQNKNRLTLEKEMLEVEREKLKMKEAQLYMKEKHIDQEIDAKVKLQKEKMLSDQKTKEMETWEIKLVEQQQWFERELSKVKNSNTESDYIKTQLMHMEKSYKSLENDYAAILNENEKLKMSLKEMSDYPSLKEELSWKSKKLDSYEKEIMSLKSELQAEKIESLNTVQRLQHQLRLTVQRHSLEPFNQNVPSSFEWAEKFEEDHKQMQQIYQSVSKRLEEQKGDIQELHRMVHCLYDKLSSAKQGQEISHSHETVLTSQKAVFNSDSNQSLRVAKLMPNDTKSRIQSYSSQEQNYRSYEEPLKFINDAKKRISELHKESQALEQKYSEYLSTVPHLISNIPSYANIPVDMPLRTNIQQPHDAFYHIGFDFPGIRSHSSKPFTFLDGGLSEDINFGKTDSHVSVSKHYPFDVREGYFVAKSSSNIHSSRTEFQKPEAVFESEFQSHKRFASSSSGKSHTSVHQSSDAFFGNVLKKTGNQQSELKEMTEQKTVAKAKLSNVGNQNTMEGIHDIIEGEKQEIQSLPHNISHSDNYKTIDNLQNENPTKNFSSPILESHSNSKPGENLAPFQMVYRYPEINSNEVQFSENSITNVPFSQTAPDTLEKPNLSSPIALTVSAMFEGSGLSSNALERDSYNQPSNQLVKESSQTELDPTAKEPCLEISCVKGSTSEVIVPSQAVLPGNFSLEKNVIDANQVTSSIAVQDPLGHLEMLSFVEEQSTKIIPITGLSSMEKEGEGEKDEALESIPSEQNKNEVKGEGEKDKALESIPSEQNKNKVKGDKVRMAPVHRHENEIEPVSVKESEKEQLLGSETDPEESNGMGKGQTTDSHESELSDLNLSVGSVQESTPNEDELW